MKFFLTKIVVTDLEREKFFYEAVCNLEEVTRIEATLDGSPVTEVVMAGTGEARLALFRFHDTVAPPAGECTIVFETDDLHDFVRRAVEAGGEVMHPPQPLPGFEVRFAYVTDPEGHIVEAIQRTA